MPRFSTLLYTAAVLFVIAVKTYAFVTYAPLALGDNNDFRAAADQFLDGSAWNNRGGLDDSPFPPTIWRSIGYSLVIAAGKSVGGQAWPWVVCAVQSLCGFAVGLLVIRLCLASGLGMGWAMATFVLHQCSVPLSTDSLVMEDALAGALGAVPILLMLIALTRGRVPGLGIFLLAGIAAALGFLIREVYQFLLPLLALGTLALLWRPAGPLRALASVALLVAPLVVTVVALQEWNHQRIGVRVTSTTGQAAYAYAFLRAAEHDPTLLDGDNPMLVALRQVNQTFDYIDSRRANEVLYEEWGLNTLEQAKLAQGLFWQGLLTHPLPFIRAALDRVRLVQQGTLFAGPLTRLDDLDWWCDTRCGDRFRTGWRLSVERFRASHDLSDLTPEAIANVAVRALTRLVGCTILAAFLLLTPLAWWKCRTQVGGPLHAALLAWALYGLWVCLYIPVSFEVRYLSPVIGGAIFAVALLVAQRKLVMAALWPKASTAAG